MNKSLIWQNKGWTSTRQKSEPNWLKCLAAMSQSYNSSTSAMNVADILHEGWHCASIGLHILISGPSNVPSVTKRNETNWINYYKFHYNHQIIWSLFRLVFCFGRFKLRKTQQSHMKVHQSHRKREFNSYFSKVNPNAKCDIFCEWFNSCTIEWIELGLWVVWAGIHC